MSTTLPSPPRRTTTATGRTASPLSHAESSTGFPLQRPKFDGALLSAYIRKLVASLLNGATWDGDQEKTKGWVNEISRRVKERMLEIEPRGFKFIVTVHLNENLGQGGRAGLSSHWEESDSATTEIWTNERIVCVVSAFAIRCY